MQGRSCMAHSQACSWNSVSLLPRSVPQHVSTLARRAPLLRSPAPLRHSHTQRHRICRPAAALPQLAAPLASLSQALRPLVNNPAALYLLGALAVVGLILAIKKDLDTPRRTYRGNVGNEYDRWTQEGIVEHYWGEHIHLGYYNEQERAAGWWKKDFKQAKYDFIDEMLNWSGAKAPKRILDVGCGLGGTSRHLAAKFPDAQVEGITLSPEQVKRANTKAAERGLSNAHFQVMDALAMEWEDDSFDLVWACESGEHMPDKAHYVREMTRVLKPGGTLVVATWCQREETPQQPLTSEDRSNLQFLYDEWAHPFFISYEEYGRLMEATGKLQQVETADWTEPTIASWRHSILVGIWDPWVVILKFNPVIWYMVVREIVTIERFHRAFARGLMTYGMIKAVKAPAPGGDAAAAAGKQLAGAAAK